MLSSVLLSWVDNLSPWQFYTSVILITISLAILLRTISKYAIRQTFTEIDADIRKLVTKELQVPTFVTAVSLGVYVAMTEFQLSIEVSSFLLSIVQTAIVVVWSRATLRVGRKGLTLLEDKRRSFEFLPLFETIFSAFVAAASITLILSVWKIDITPVLASAGVLGVAIGFAAKDTVANFFGAIALYLDDTYRIGDYIVLDSGEEGVVMEITMRSTVIKTLDDTMVTVPNSSLNSSVVENQSHPRDSKRMTPTVSVAYGSDLDLVEELLYEAAVNCDGVHEKPEPSIRLVEFGGSGIQYEVQLWTSPKHPARTRHSLLKNIQSRFDENNIEIPYPQRTIHIEEGPEE